MTNAELLRAGNRLQGTIEILDRELKTLLSVHRPRLGIARVRADYLPQPKPDGVFYLLTRYAPSGTDEPSPEDWAFVTGREMSFEQAEAAWDEIQKVGAPLRQRIAKAWRELEEIDMQARDYTGAEQRPDGTWILRNKHGGILEERDGLGRPIPDEKLLRRLAYSRWREHVFTPSPFNLPNPTYL